ncbi:hypothetical protein ACJDU8_03175 [Clostridium sp. WILCCON 0269]|uniref:ECF transporter S component n=1 Tax=Candidatus Clostridium eludens TaxID=3381663 RepID=A0ABW8SI86_9CLOT
MKNSVIYTALMGVIIALTIAFKVLMMAAPNITIVTAVVIAVTIVFSDKDYRTGIKSGLIIAIMYPIITGMIYGIGVWTILQALCWMLVVFVSLLLKGLIGRQSVLKLSIMGFSLAFVYGFSMNICMAVLSGTMVTSVMAYFIMSFPYDLAHAISTLVALPVLVKLLKLVKI